MKKLPCYSFCLGSLELVSQALTSMFLTTEIEARHCSTKEQLTGYPGNGDPVHGDSRQQHCGGTAGQTGRGEPALRTALSTAAGEGKLAEEASATG